MPLPPMFNPNVSQAPAQFFPSMDSPETKALLQALAISRLGGWQMPRGLVNQMPDRAIPGAPGVSLVQPVGDVLRPDITGWKGLLGPIQQGENLVHDPLGPGRMAPGTGAGGGLLGSKWRDPTFVESYAKTQGIPPGLLNPASPRSAPVVEHPAVAANRRWAEGEAMSDARQAAMTVKNLSDLQKGARIQMHPATDTWMRGDREGEVVGFNKAKNYFRVKMDVSGRTIKVSPENLFRKLPPDWLPERSGEYRTPWENVTQAQWAKMNDMQREVWKRDAGYSGWPATIRQGFNRKMEPDRPSLLRPQEEAPTKGPWSNMSSDLWIKMSPENRSQWLRDADWRSWPTVMQRDFIERFMPNGIGGKPK